MAQNKKKAAKAAVPPVKQLKCGMALFGTAAVMASSIGLSGMSVAPAFAADAPGNATNPAIDGVNVIDSGTTDKTAGSAVRGRVAEMWAGTPVPAQIGDQTLHPALEGVRVYAQWYEKDGSASPIYTGVTDANGDYNIIMKDFVAPDGTVRKFDADPNLPEGEKFRIWAEAPEGMSLFYAWEGGQIAPPGIVMDGSFGASYDLGPNTLNNINFFFAENTGDLMGDAANTKEQSHNDYPNAEGFIWGKAFWNNAQNLGSYNLDATYAKNGNEDPAARGITVQGAYLSDYALSKIYTDGKAYMGENIRGLFWSDADEKKLQDWIAEQIALEGKDLWIAETVTTTTDANGEYSLQFNGTYGRAWDDKGYNGPLNKSSLNWGGAMPDDVAAQEGLPAGSDWSELFNRVAFIPGCWFLVQG